MKLRFLIFVPVIFFVLLGCVKENDTSSEMNKVSSVPVNGKNAAIEKADSDTIKPIPILKIKALPKVHRDTLSRKPKLDTAIVVLNYCDSIKGGSGVSDRERTIDMIIIHSSYSISGDTFSISGIIHQFEKYHVSAHYLIGRDGTIYRLVPENNISFHAGDSQLPADPSKVFLNRSSIGIEIANSETSGPTEAQYEKLIKLVNNIRARFDIKYIYRHSDISPGRKSDPWSFDWDGFLNKLHFENPQPKSQSQSTNQ